MTKPPVLHERRGLIALFLLLGALPAALALESPKDRPVLTISGKIAVTNSASAAVWDMAKIEALPQTVFTTRTPWYNQPVTFSGPLLRDVLAAVRTSGTRIRATALNDYRITIPITDAERFQVIVATRMNGQPMPVRSKGPLFIVYPFDSRAELHSTIYYERSIWQLRALYIE